jgi:hypothetical protein
MTALQLLAAILVLAIYLGAMTLGSVKRRRGWWIG